MMFKTLAMSKMVYLALMTDVPKVIIEQLQKIQEIKRPKVKQNFI